MKTIRELLLDADPLRHEPAIANERRDAARAAVVAAARDNAPSKAAMPFRFARLALVAVVIIGIAILGSRLWPRIGFETYAHVRFEVRLAEDMPAPGLREANVAGNDRTIYVHPEIVLSNEDVARAEVSKDQNGRVAVSLQFTTEGARKIQAASADHIGRPVAILIDDVVIMAPVLTSALGDSAQITGMTRDEAERIANGMN
jgi:hypothetical protein